MTTPRCLCDQAVVLVGGEGTRLRPITSRVPKPVAPVVGRPFVSYILENLARHGVDRAVFSTGFLAEAIQAEIGDGRRFGLRVSYVVEEEPLGTAGAIKNAEAELTDGCFLAFNGDVLTDVDLTALVAYHCEKGSRATILLTAVDDPRRYGLVNLRDDGSVAEFLEKPGSDYVGQALINAGVYVLERDVLDMIPAGQTFSIERGVFPRLAAAGELFGFASNAYWRDIGTPESYLEAHFDLLQRSLRSPVEHELGESFVYVSPRAVVDGGARVVPPAYVADGVTVAAGAQVGPLAVVGAGSHIGAGARIVESVLQNGVEVGPGVTLEHCVVARLSVIGSESELSKAVLGEGCRVGAGNELAHGLCLFPDTELPDGSVRFVQFEGREGR